MSKQKSTKYEATEKEKALLEALINPENRMKSITDICKAAKCTRNVYYDAFAKEGFVALYKSMSEDLIKQNIAPVINAFIREAERGSFQHGKVILEMAGMYTDKSVKQNIKDKYDIEEQKARIEKMKLDIKVQTGSDGTDGVQEFLKATKPTKEDIEALYKDEVSDDEEKE